MYWATLLKNKTGAFCEVNCKKMVAFVQYALLTTLVNFYTKFTKKKRFPLIIYSIDCTAS